MTDKLAQFWGNEETIVDEHGVETVVHSDQNGCRTLRSNFGGGECGGNYKPKLTPGDSV